tara:strand:+ start:40 stop:426 length:387 start_codon:yes stop_codon:yes gene_type:complete
MKKKSKFFFIKTKKNLNKNTVEKCEVIKEDIKEDINEYDIDHIRKILEEVNLTKIRLVSKEIYNHNIMNNMIKYIKNNNNINIKYDIWLKQFNEADYIQEFEYKIRDNKIYHDIWVKLFYHEEYEIIY